MDDMEQLHALMDEAQALGRIPVEDDPYAKNGEEKPAVEISEEDKKRFGGWTLSELWLEAGKERRWLRFPYLPEVGVIMLGGRPKTAKTFIAGHWTVTLAEEKKRTTFVEEEGDPFTLKKRFEAALGINIPSTFDEYVRVPFHCGLTLNDDDSVNRFIAVQKLFKPHLVVLDALYVLAKVKLKEQDEVAVVLRNLVRISNELQCCVLIIHHARKGAVGATREQLDDIDDILGSALIGANVDQLILANKPKEQEKGKLKIHLVCPNNGSRLGEPFERRLWTLTNGAVPTITDVEDPQEKKAKEKEAEVETRVEEVTDLLREKLCEPDRFAPGVRLSVHKLFKETGRKVRTELVSEAAGRLCKEGHLKLVGGTYYRVIPASVTSGKG